MSDVEPNSEDGDEVDEETEAVAGPSGGGDADNVRELLETPKPKAKSSGKKTSKKLEVQHRILDLLEKDEPVAVAEDDPVDLMFHGIAKRVKKSLPEEEAFTLLHKLQGSVNDHISTYKRIQVVAKANFMPDETNEVIQVLQVEQPTIVRPPPPPMMMRAAAPPPIRMQTPQQVQVQVPVSVQSQANGGQQLFYQNELQFEQL